MKYIREHLKEELGVSDEEYRKMVEDKMETSMTKQNMDNLGEVTSAQLALFNDMGQMMAGMMMKIMELEAKSK
ncbi:hypothetical protein [Bhargavaea ginsengi]|uniref:hypothetical protein n=1 Tax=Bhargavaea ginsengi TaxID=426757 RepID=UPI003C73A317